MTHANLDSSSSDRWTEDFEDDLREACQRRRIGLYIEARARRAGRPYVHLKQRGSTLGVFHSCREALSWLVPTGT